MWSEKQRTLMNPFINYELYVLILVVVEDDLFSPEAISEVLLPPGFTSPTLPDVLGPMLLLVSYQEVFAT